MHVQNLANTISKYVCCHNFNHSARGMVVISRSDKNTFNFVQPENFFNFFVFFTPSNFDSIKPQNHRIKLLIVISWIKNRLRRLRLLAMTFTRRECKNNIGEMISSDTIVQIASARK